MDFMALVELNPWGRPYSQMCNVAGGGMTLVISFPVITDATAFRWVRGQQQAVAGSSMAFG